MRARFGRPQALVWLARARSVEGGRMLPPGTHSAHLARPPAFPSDLTPVAGTARGARYWVGVGMFASFCSRSRLSFGVCIPRHFFLISFIETSDITEARGAIAAK